VAVVWRCAWLLRSVWFASRNCIDQMAVWSVAYGCSALALAWYLVVCSGLSLTMHLRYTLQ
jgi:hypothetical protein